MTRKKVPIPDWRAAAEKLAADFPRERLHPAVTSWADAAAGAGKWSVAFSGGADSLLLLLLLWAHWPKRRSRLQALHFDHRLRGRDSDRDRIFCRDVCRALDVKLVDDRWATAQKDASEAEARSARHEFFRRHSRVLWLGHQQDDIAESMLMRLARGSGTEGLAAPRPMQSLPPGRLHLRPLLTVKKVEIEQALRSAGLPWREDATNATDAFFRNRVRQRVLKPWIEASGRDALAGAARSRELLEEDEDALDAWLESLAPLRKNGELDLAVLAGKPRALWRRALHAWLLRHPAAGTPSRQAFDDLLAAAQLGKSTRRSLGTAGFAVIRDGRLRFVFFGKRENGFQRRAN